LSGEDDGATPKGPEPDESLSLDEVVHEPFDADSLAQLLGERYIPLALLGEGTFGEVIRARTASWDERSRSSAFGLEAFAAPAQLEEVKTRFLREAQVAAQLQHPNIVTAHDIISKAGSSCIVMELMEGRDLQSLLQERGRLGLDETLDILGKAAAALDHAHASGIIHRDIKPANVMIEPSGGVKVMDFGIAKVEQGGAQTSTGLTMGTPSYMSPEQARGSKVDRRADVFSLGCVLYECLTGKKSFHDDSLTAILLKVVAEPPPPIDFEALALPRAFDGVLKRGMAKEPSRRFRSPGELMEAARGVEVAPPPVSPTGTLAATPGAGPAGTTVPEPAHPERPPSPASRGTSAARGEHKRLPWLLAALAAAIVAVGILGFVALRTPDAGSSRPLNPRRSSRRRAGAGTHRPAVPPGAAALDHRPGRYKTLSRDRHSHQLGHSGTGRHDHGRGRQAHRDRGSRGHFLRCADLRSGGPGRIGGGRGSARGVGFDDRLRPFGDAGGRVLRSEDARGDEGSVHQQEELGGQGVRRAQVGFAAERGEALEDLALVVEGDLVGGVGGVGKLGHRPLESASHAGGARGLAPQGPERAQQLRAGIGGGRHLLVEPVPEAPVGALEVGHDQVVLRGEVSIESHLGDTRLGDDPVDPDRVDAVLVEEAGGGLEDPLARIVLSPSSSHRLTLYRPV
jgi:hypothetical protein